MVDLTGDGSSPKGTSLVPAACRWLGGLGLIPFLGLAIAGFWPDGLPSAYTSFALTAYGAVILSFLGGIHWGLAVADFGSARGDGASYRRLLVSVMPSLIAFGALLLTGTAALLVLAASFASMLAIDWSATRRAEAPAWYPKLRLPLTAGVVASLVAGAVF